MKTNRMIAALLALALPLAPLTTSTARADDDHKGHGAKSEHKGHEHKENLISLGTKDAGPFKVKVGQFGKATAGMKELHVWVQVTPSGSAKVDDVEARVVAGDQQTEWEDADDLEGKKKFEVEVENLPKDLGKKPMIEIKIEGEDDKDHVVAFELSV